MDYMKRVLFDTHCYRNVFIVCTILFTVVFLNTLSSVLNLFLLVWGGLIICKDILSKKTIIKSKIYIPLLVFLIFDTCTLIINRELNLFENFKIYLLSMLQFFILFAFDNEEDEEYVFKNIMVFNRIIIIMTFILSSVSLIIYLLAINKEIGDYVIGMSAGGTMLNGVYTGPNTAGPLAALSIIATLMNMELRHDNKKNKFLYINIIIQYIFICMTNSRATLYSLLIFSFFYAIFYFNGLRNRTCSLGGFTIIYLISKVMNDFVYIVHKCIFDIIGFVKYLFLIVKQYFLYILGNTQSVGEISLNNTSSEIITEAANKEITMGFLNGRAQLWECGIDIFRDNFFFGIGSRNVTQVALNYRAFEDLPGIYGGGMHNLIIQTLVSNGILGFVALGGFLIICIIEFIKYFIGQKLTGKNSKIVLIVVLALLMQLINNMAEVNIFYTASYMATIFWTYLGFGIFMTKKI